ncbi:LysR family transcriptional regulator [Pontibacillus litoralis]|uniref:LysR family transcriptional regulator n=1 Tax=Pontibacillus litoralis JSM 072002 TaxID=1385512 RepID=A0A0A5HLR8_9BACI|nr:LysR family transcriptional regulator [Pontibacillus litoralis]KGX84547.1 LysR family transcriptional regulator [Pontibacillus litoralis JSM 072002]
MDLRQLRYFRAVAEEKQITKAANKLHMAQPPLSKQMKLMEEELNVRLFDRQGRVLELTKAGEILYQKAGHILSDFEDVLVEVRETSEGIRGPINIGANKSCFSFLSATLNRFQVNHPNVCYQLREGDTYLLEECIRNREIELAVVRKPLYSEEIDTLPLPSEPYVLVYPNTWELTSDDDEHIKFAQLKDIPLMLLHRIKGTGQFELIVEEFRAQGVEPNVICECPDAAMLLSLVSSGMGATIVPESTLSAFPFQHLKSYKLANTNITAKSVVIWHKDRYLTKASHQLIQTFKEQFFHEQPKILL